MTRLMKVNYLRQNGQIQICLCFLGIAGAFGPPQPALKIESQGLSQQLQILKFLLEMSTAVL